MENLIGFLFIVATIAVLAMQVITLRFVRRHRLTTERATEDAIATIALDLNRIFQSVQIALASRGIEVKDPLAPPGADEEISEEERTRQSHIRKAELFRKVRR